MKAILIPLAAVPLAVAAGCASAPRDGGFGDVSKTVAERTGVAVVHWDQGTDDDEKAQSSVDALLARELTPDAAVQVALLNNADLQATYEDLGVARAELVRAGLLRNPVFDADVKFVEGGGGEIVELAVVQDFLDVFQIPLRRRAAADALEAAKLRVAGEAIDLAGRVRAAVYELQAARQALELRRTVLAAAEASSDLAGRMRAAGNFTALEAANERATYEQARLDAAAAEADVLVRRERVNVLLGLWGPRTRWAVAARLPDVPEPPDAVAAEDVERRAVERSLEIQAARARARVAAGTLGLRRDFALLGELEVGAAGEREPDGEWAVGPAVSVPIPLFDTGAASVSAARAELRRSEKQLRATAVRVRSAARAARDALTSAHGRAVYYRRVVLPLRGEITKQTQLQLNAMAAGPFQLLDAKRREVETAAAMVEAQRDYWVARTRLEQLLTGGRMTDGEAVSSGRATAVSAAPRDAH